ncbi:MAG: translation elongation factor Ts [Balneolaceae bacterium]
MSISAKDVKKLRDITGAGMMDCKKALAESNGDFDKAVEILRKKGQKVSEKRADREANQGLVFTKVSEDGKQAAAIEINCETDFVARNDDFQNQTRQFLDAAYQHETSTVEELLKQKVGDLTINEHLKAMVGKIGEKIEINRVIVAKTDGTFVEYVHPGNQLCVLAEFEGELKDAEIGKDIAMQIAAMNPIAVKREDVDDSVIQKELEIAKEQLINEGKPAEIAEKAAQGKLRRFYEERVLLEQKFVKDNGISVQKYLEANNAPLVSNFHRIQLGEG